MASLLSWIHGQHLENAIMQPYLSLLPRCLLYNCFLVSLRCCPERHVSSLSPANVSSSSIVAQNATSWMPAHAAERHSHCTNMQNTLGYKNILGLVGSTPQKHPSHGKKVLGGMTNQQAVLTRVR
jgi:hypothetical protein